MESRYRFENEREEAVDKYIRIDGTLDRLLKSSDYPEMMRVANLFTWDMDNGSPNHPKGFELHRAAFELERVVNMQIAARALAGDRIDVGRDEGDFYRTLNTVRRRLGEDETPYERETSRVVGRVQSALDAEREAEGGRVAPTPPSVPKPYRPKPTVIPDPIVPKPPSGPKPYRPKPTVTPDPIVPKPPSGPKPYKPKPTVTPDPIVPKPPSGPKPYRPRPTVTPDPIVPKPPSGPKPYRPKPTVIPDPIVPRPPDTPNHRKRKPTFLPKPVGPRGTGTEYEHKPTVIPDKNMPIPPITPKPYKPKPTVVTDPTGPKDTDTKHEQKPTDIPDPIGPGDPKEPYKPKPTVVPKPDGPSWSPWGAWQRPQPKVYTGGYMAEGLGDDFSPARAERRQRFIDRYANSEEGFENLKDGGDIFEMIDVANLWTDPTYSKDDSPAQKSNLLALSQELTSKIADGMRLKPVDNSTRTKLESDLNRVKRRLKDQGYNLGAGSGYEEVTGRVKVKNESRAWRFRDAIMKVIGYEKGKYNTKGSFWKTSKGLATMMTYDINDLGNIVLKDDPSHVVFDFDEKERGGDGYVGITTTAGGRKYSSKVVRFKSDIRDLRRNLRLVPDAPDAQHQNTGDPTDAAILGLPGHEREHEAAKQKTKVGDKSKGKQPASKPTEGTGKKDSSGYPVPPKTADGSRVTIGGPTHKRHLDAVYGPEEGERIYMKELASKKDYSGYPEPPKTAEGGVRETIGGPTRKRNLDAVYGPEEGERIYRKELASEGDGNVDELKGRLNPNQVEKEVVDMENDLIKKAEDFISGEPHRESIPKTDGRKGAGIVGLDRDENIIVEGFGNRSLIEPTPGATDEENIEKIGGTLLHMQKTLGEFRVERGVAGFANTPDPVRMKGLSEAIARMEPKLWEAEAAYDDFTSGARDRARDRRESQVQPQGQGQTTSERTQDEEQIMDRIEEIRNRSDEIREDAQLLEEQSGDLSRLKRLSEWVKENGLALGGITIGVAALVTTIISATRSVIVKTAKSASKWGQALAKFAKKVWPWIGPIISAIGTIIGWGAKGLSWLADNLWMVVILIVIAAVNTIYEKSVKRKRKRFK